MHNTLQRQLNKYIGTAETLPTDPTVWHQFLTAVSQTYEHYEEDHILIEHSLELSSKELNEKSKKLQEQLLAMETQKKELEEMNKFMINRELRMVSLKEEITKLQSQLTTLEEQHKHKELKPTE